MIEGIEEFRALLRRDDVDVAVSDLDGVLRVFDPALWPRLDDRLGLERGSTYRAVLRNPLLGEVVRGRASHRTWRAATVDDLVARGADSETARRSVQDWADEPARLDEDVVDLLRGAARAGEDVFVFTNGTDRVREEITALGVEDLLGPGGEHLLNSAELGAAKPDQEAFAAAHARIEEVLGRTVEREAVAFLDDSAHHVRGALVFGWRAVLHRPA